MKKILLTLTLICFVALPSAVLGCWTYTVWNIHDDGSAPGGLLITDSDGKIFFGEQQVSEAYVSIGLWREHLTLINNSDDPDAPNDGMMFYLYPVSEGSSIDFNVYRAALDDDGVITDYELIRVETFQITEILYQRIADYITPGYLPVGCSAVSIEDDLALTTDEMPCLVYTEYDLDYHVKNLVSFDADLWSSEIIGDPELILDQYHGSWFIPLGLISDSIVVWRQQETETTTVRSIDFSGSSLYSTGDALPLSPLVTLARPVETIKTYDVTSTSYLIANAGQRVNLVLPGNIENLEPEVTTWDVDIKSATLRITDSDGVAEFYTVENPPCGKAIPIFGRYSINPWGIGINDELVIDLILSTGSVSSDAGTGSGYSITKPTAPRSVITVSALERPER